MQPKNSADTGKTLEELIQQLNPGSSFDLLEVAKAREVHASMLIREFPFNEVVPKQLVFDLHLAGAARLFLQKYCDLED